MKTQLNDIYPTRKEIARTSPSIVTMTGVFSFSPVLGSGLSAGEAIPRLSQAAACRATTNQLPEENTLPYHRKDNVNKGQQQSGD